MLGSNPFYHGITRKVIIAFGQIFSDIKIQRFNSSGIVDQLISVPISYGNREKWYQRLKEEPTLDQRVLITLPRIGFEISGMSYDSSRKINKITQYTSTTPNSAGNVLSAYTPVPYNIGFNLYIMTKTNDDMLQIVEQILPFFAPQYNLSINLSEDLGMSQDIPVTMESINLSDSYEGPMEDRREIISTLSFVAKTEYLGPVNNANNLITSVNIKLDPESGPTGRQVTVAVNSGGTINNYTPIEELFDIPRPIPS